MSATLHLIHKISVSLFLLAYVIRLIGLLGGLSAINNLFQQKAVRILVDMVISTVFLVTGVWMLINIPGSVLNTMIIMKIVVVFISIPLAVIGFKKSKKSLAVLSVLLLIGAYGMAEMGKKRPVVVKSMVQNAVSGEEIWVAGNCKACHGDKGANPVVSIGAINLAQSKLSDEDLKQVLSHGRNTMPAYGKQFSESQINELTEYVKSLRQP